MYYHGLRLGFGLEWCSISIISSEKPVIYVALRKLPEQRLLGELSHM